MQNLFSDGESICIPEWIRSLEKDDDIFLYGNGVIAETVWDELKNYNRERHIKGVIVSDDYWHKGDTFHDLKIQNWSRINHAVNRMQLILTFDPVKYEKKLVELINSENVTKIYIYDSFNFLQYKNWLFLDNPKLYYIDCYYKLSIPRGLSYEYYVLHKEQFDTTYHWLEDMTSKRTMLTYLKGHIEIANYPMKKVWKRENYFKQYFPDIIFFGEDEVIVDCGAFTGDTFAEYLIHAGKFKKYYALEPDKNCFEQLVLQTSYVENVVTVPKGAYSKTCRMNFGKAAGCGVITEEGDDLVEVVALDDLIDDETKVTYIKMDIEGSELEALRGARRIIEKNHPKLAICVYHKKEDLIKIPQLIKELDETYRLYLRAHWLNLSELVLYAL